MAQSVRQRNLFSAEDFRLIYDSFKQANFQAYDYDSIRGALVDYVKQQYPENFNDWIQSSEFVALIETLAFLAHSLAFRIDQAGRENFLSTAERRASILRIADFLGYTPTRHQPARGELKVVSIRTTQDVFDINGNSLKNKSVDFEDDFQNFLLVMNSVLSENNKFGRPTSSIRIGNIKNDIYATNIAPGRDVVFSFNGEVNGARRPFEVHGLEINQATKSLQESEPNPEDSFDLVYKNDGQGLGSNNTGFFVGFKQGSLQFNDVNADSAISNLIIDIGTTNVNNNDVWVQEINNDGQVQETWTKVDSSFGANTVFNNIRQDNRKLYTVKTVEDDNINVVFGDGVFSDIPNGLIRIWYRNGLNQTYTLDPEDIGTATFGFKYNAADNNTYTVTFTLELQEPVTNAAAQESVTSIKNNAGRVFAAQDRLITAEDYSAYPLSVSENVKKIKAINRTYAGHSRFIKPQDPTGQYQSVDMLADDGYIYSEPVNYRTTLRLPSTLNAEQIYERYVADVIKNPEVINLFYDKFVETDIDFELESTSFEWQQITSGYRGSTGYFTQDGVIKKIGSNATTDMNIARPGSIVEFIETPYNNGTIGTIGQTLQIINAGSGYTATPLVEILGTGNGATAEATIAGGQLSAVTITNGGTGYQNPVAVRIVGGGGTGAEVAATASSATRTWARVVDVVLDGQGIIDSNGNPTGLTTRGQGAVVLNKAIPNTARVTRVFPAYATQFSLDERDAIITEIEGRNTFGLRFDAFASEWKIVRAGDLAPTNENSPNFFSFDNAGNTSSSNLDNSWIVRVEYTADAWTIVTRRTRYVFGSDERIRFYNQNGNMRFNIETNKPERDRIIVKGVNTRPNGNGFSIGNDQTFFVYKYYTEPDGYTDGRKVIITVADVDNDNYPDDPLAFKDITGADTINLNTIFEDGFAYTVRSDTGTAVPGREFLDFKWKRVSASNYRIDPSLSNIIDVFVLNQNYDNNFRKWIADSRQAATRPEPPDAVDLERQFASLNTKKAISDSIVYRAAEYKVLFGELADVELQGKFRVVKVAGTTLTDNEIKSRILAIIKDFFNIENWDFGEIFYFTELSAYIHQQMPGVISSVVITPIQSNSKFGDLFQVIPESNELFIPDVTLQDIEIVNSLNTLR